ncbi:MAG: hypothetical protein PHE50_10090 [Dehalococcoidales bacterium]|nr:hypothetical protein [Dehalococcoidales bacterium]
MAEKKQKQAHEPSPNLRGLTWVYGLNHRFAPNPHWSNAHCAVCRDEFKVADPANQEHEGYTSLGGQHWICVRCYEEHRSACEWRTNNWD